MKMLTLMRPQVHGGSYKRAFLERHLQAQLEAFRPLEMDLFDIKDLLIAIGKNSPPKSSLLIAHLTFSRAVHKETGGQRAAAAHNLHGGIMNAEKVASPTCQAAQRPGEDDENDDLASTQGPPSAGGESSHVGDPK